MLTGLSIKFFSLLMPLIIAFNGLSFSLPFISDSAEITYAYSNEESGSAAGTVTVNAKYDGKYKLYWGMDSDSKLSVDVSGYEVYYSEFATVKVDDGKGSEDIYGFTAIPDGAETILAYKGGILVGSADIPEEKQADRGEREYAFGALSDLHFKRYNQSLSGDDALLTFPNALNFLDACGVSLVGMSGDLSRDGEEYAFKNFNLIAAEYDFPVYTCTGNHDVSDYFTLVNWQKYVNAGVYGAEKADGVENVADNGLDFVYAPDAANGDVFIFLSQYQWDYNSDSSRILKDEQLDWLEIQLKKYKDTTVYLFFHTFLNNPVEGEVPEMGEGNLINNAGHAYDLPFTEGCPDEVRFEDLMDEYENVVFFNGHSHWAYDMQKLNPQLNITDYNGEFATMVHISSVSSPRRTTANIADTTEHAMRSSEGMLIEVYGDEIVFTAIDFLRGEMLAYATYTAEK
ncbi:MAG: metallophosphoesterase [Clostridia bacterium]|nr:metallophosphoesterase [Clostridia bacterium]